MNKDKLMKLAIESANNAYAPYSKFKVGAALITDQGNFFTGCNIENASYSLTICAERVAVFKAVEAGERKINEIAIYVDAEESFPPCGACRQVLTEFSNNMQVYYKSKNSKIVEISLEKLLPANFSLEK